ncbi:bone marrow stromal antigen 2 [Suncus etruscus]|uniref:bone marrow stromal antigen 2 n=1 Tax=Suncus etruscus TaxID=109475 RepID=UPI002110D85A|nr:bone marrow stromal antigen 2 [Suncus etruscus]
MAPTFYHRAPMPYLEEHGKEPQKLRFWQCLALVAIAFLLATLIPLLYFMPQMLNQACWDGLRVQQQCLNDTQSLQQSLKSTQHGLGEARAQLANYNHTVETLLATLAKKEKDHQQKMQAREEEHQREIQKLKEQLQEAVAKLESKSEGSEGRSRAASAGTPDPRVKETPVEGEKTETETSTSASISSRLTLSAWAGAGLIVLWSLGFL